MDARVEVALQLTLKNLNAAEYMKDTRLTNAKDTNIKLAEAVTEFFNTVYDKLPKE